MKSVRARTSGNTHNYDAGNVHSSITYAFDFCQEDKFSSQSDFHGCSKFEGEISNSPEVRMSKTAWNRYFIGLAVITSLALLVWIAGVKAGAQNTSAQNAISGDWTATVSNKDNSKIQLNLERRSERGGKHQHGQSYEFSDLQGLSREQALNGGQVSFSLVREAGKTDFEGSFQNGKGSGTFRFTANPAFARP